MSNQRVFSVLLSCKQISKKFDNLRETKIGGEEQNHPQSFFKILLSFILIRHFLTCKYVKFQIMPMCLTLDIGAFINLSCLFFPKLYIIIWRPEKNQRRYVVTTEGLRCHFGSMESMHNKYDLSFEFLVIESRAMILKSEFKLELIFILVYSFRNDYHYGSALDTSN